MKPLKTTIKSVLFASASAAVIALSSASASATTVDELASKLDKAMALIEKQSSQMKEMENELSTIRAKRFNAMAPAAGGHTNIEARLAEVEETVFDLDEKVGSRAVVNAFDAKKFDIGGFVHTSFTHIDSDEGSASAWDTQNFEILIKAELDDDWSAFFAGGFLREEGDGMVLNAAGTNPEFVIANKNPQIIAWVNYQHNDALNLQVGRMITPHGIINIEHFPQVLLDPRQPQFLRPFSGDTLFPNFVTGAQAHGKHFLESDNYVSYNAYIAAAQSDPESPVYGGRIAGTHGDSGITVGLNASMGEREDDSTVANTSRSSDYTLVGADLLIDHGWLLWKSEVFSSDEDEVVDAAGNLRSDRLGWYTQPAWRINDQWTAFYRYDHLDDGNDSNGGDTTENVVGLTFKPIPNVHLRLTATKLDLEKGGTITQDRDAKVIQASTTVSF